jgi:myosin heavy subunit
MSVAVGDRVWVPHNEHAWLCGRVTKVDPSVVAVDTEVGQVKLKPAEANKLEQCGGHIDHSFENLVDLDELSEGAILHHTRKRYATQHIYTNVGAILVAVNPFEKLNIYSEKDIKVASNPTVSKPHVFTTAYNAYQQLRMNLKNQAVLISGESGAGKTETTKKVLTYLANVAPGMKKSKDEPGVEQKILESNPLLEALGNAKTLRNNNSSRFGKWMKVDFDHDFRIQGCEIVNYLLEKSRVVIQTKGERNYHIFYYLIAGADPNLKQQLRLGRVEDYRLLMQSGCCVIEDVDDAEEFKELVRALVTLQFVGEFADTLFRIMSAILHVGNLEFDADGDTARVSAASMRPLQYAGELLGADAGRLSAALIEKQVLMGRGEVVSIKLDRIQSADSRDTLCKALYSNLFDCVIKKVNESLKQSQSPFSIGILDIFGFEIFEENSFEQLSINYANEKLQLHFNEVIFNEELKMYTEEGIPAEAIQFVDNSECVALIEGKPMGLLSLLDEECSLGKATDLTYASKIESVFGKGRPSENQFFIKHRTVPSVFTVIHFAGPVDYSVNGFLEKNRDNLSLTLQEVMTASNNPIISQLFASSEVSSPAKQGKAAQKLTLGGQFRTQLIGLVSHLKQLEPHFIRCVKPNHVKKARIFDGQLILRQLRYAGLFEAIRIRKSGFAYRVTHQVFASQYSILVDGLQTKLRKKEINYTDASKMILNHVTKQNILNQNMWFLGFTKVFIKANKDRILLDRERAKRVLVYALRIQEFGKFAIQTIKRTRLELEKKREEAAKNRILQEKLRAAVVMQKYTRGFLVRRAMALMDELVNLRKYLAARDIEAVEHTINLIETRGGDMMPQAFKQEMKMARTMAKLIEIQDKFVMCVEKALISKNVAEMNRLLVKCDRLDLSDHPVVVRAKLELVKLHKKRQIMMAMVDFLRNENDNCEAIPEVLAEAVELDVDPDFIGKVQRIYESASPRLRARNKLRRAVETVDYEGLLEGCREVEELQEHHPNFAMMELRAARSMLRMIELEGLIKVDIPRDINRPASVKEAEFVVPTGPRLTDNVLGLCHEIVNCSVSDEKAKLKHLKSQLLISAGGNQERFEMYIRSFKWSKLFCAWKYPEIQQKVTQSRAKELAAMESSGDQQEQLSRILEDDASEEPTEDELSRLISGEGEFFGLRPGEARFSKYIVQALHREVNPQSGDAPPSIVAALGAMEAALADPFKGPTMRAGTGPASVASASTSSPRRLLSPPMKAPTPIVLNKKTVNR